MKVVGEKLEEWSHSEADNFKKDLFARSAFNRYYYATFLITREMLGELKSNWKGTAHAEIPNLLVDALKKPVITQLKISARHDLITDGEAGTMRDKLQTATTNLADLLKEAYGARIIADYQPEIKVEFRGKVICLDRHKLNGASKWPSRAESYCKSIRSVWKGVGLV